MDLGEFGDVLASFKKKLGMNKDQNEDKVQ
jgi:hypothetical protein